MCVWDLYTPGGKAGTNEKLLCGSQGKYHTHQKSKLNHRAIFVSVALWLS